LAAAVSLKMSLGSTPCAVSAFTWERNVWSYVLALA
jgi:hypothetical protein